MIRVKIAVLIAVVIFAAFIAIDFTYAAEAEAQQPAVNFTRLFEEEFGGTVFEDIKTLDGSPVIYRPVYVRHQSDSMVVLEEGYYPPSPHPHDPELFWNAVDLVRSYGYEIHDFSRITQRSFASFGSEINYIGQSVVILIR